MSSLLRTSLMALAFALATHAAAPASAQPVSWPAFGDAAGVYRVDEGAGRGDGLTNSVPDFIGPVDGSAKLTIFTEGNHYPALLPLLFDAFPAWCVQTGRCEIEPGDILVVTLPQVMIVSGLEQGGFRLGNARIPVRPDAPVFPDLVMLGAPVMQRLAEQDMIAERPRIFAKHRGLGLLLRKDRAGGVSDLAGFASSDLSLVIATPNEAGARRQYLATLEALLGEQKTADLLVREVPDFRGRLGIQHRDVPYALLNGIADAGILFGHLARFYAETWPDDLAFVEVPQAEPFGQEITVARTVRDAGNAAHSGAFLEFLFEAAPEAYAQRGFARSSDFAFGQEVAH